MPLARLLLVCLLGLPLPAFATDPLPPDVDAVRNAVRAGQLDDAVERGESLVKQRPDDVGAWWWLGRAYGIKAQQASLFGKPGWAG